jgi:O-antigen ligase
MKKILTTNNFFLLAIFGMPLYLIHLSVFGLPTNVFELLVILAIVFGFIKNRKELLNKLSCISSLLVTSILLILLGIILSIFFNNNYLAGLGIFKSWFLIPIIFSYTLYASLDSELTLEKVFLSIYFSTALVAAISFVYKIAGAVTYDNRLEAFYSSPNYLAMYLAPGIFFGCYFLIKSFLQKKYSKNFFTHVFLLAILLIALYLTYSYGAWLAVFAAFLIMLMFLIHDKKHLFASIILLIVAAVCVFQTNTQKFSGLFSERSSFASRTMIWDASFLMIRQHPFLGIGPGNFQDNYLSLQKYFPPYLEWAVPEPHNIFLAFWIQTGLLGLAGFLLLLFFIFHMLWQLLKNKKDTAFAIPLLGYFAYTILHGLTDTPYWKNDLSFLFWISVFLLLSVRSARTEKLEGKLKD